MTPLPLEKTSGTCAACHTQLAPSKGKRSRKWCSERCRKRQYAGTCERCGAATNGSNGRGSKAARICFTCHLDNLHAQSAQRAVRKPDKIIAMWNQGMTATEIAVELGSTPGSIRVKISQLRYEGADLPYRRPQVIVDQARLIAAKCRMRAAA